MLITLAMVPGHSAVKCRNRSAMLAGPIATVLHAMSAPVPTRTAIAACSFLFVACLLAIQPALAMGSQPLPQASSRPSASDDTADDNKEKKWDISAPHGPTKTVDFTVDEGTWLDIDVAPDGRIGAVCAAGADPRLPTPSRQRARMHRL